MPIPPRRIRPSISNGPKRRPLGTVYRGAEGVESLSADIAARYRSLQAELRELREVGDWVLALVTVTFAGAGQAAVQTYEFAWIYLVEDGRVRRAHGFRSEA